MPALRQRSAVDLLGHHYEHVRLLHRTARCTTYLAEEIGIGRRVVLKVPSDSGPRWARESLEREAAVLAAVGSHPNIVTLYQRFELPDGRPALAMEHLPGRVLREPPDDGRMTPAAVVALGIKLSGALATLHGAGYAHCDVRPDNLLVSACGEPVLVGFDEAVRLGTGLASRPALQAASAYTAPELLQGDEATQRADVYGIAATLYALVAGHGAFRAYAGESSAAIVLRVLTGRVRPIRLPDVPLAMSDLLTWALTGDPASRPPSASWLAEEMARIQTDEGWPRTSMIGG